MFERSFEQKLIERELQSHIDDMIGDLANQGMDTEQARKKAIETFGDIKKISCEVRKIHGKFLGTNFFSPTTALVALYSLISVSFYAISVAIKLAIQGTYIELAIYGWINIGIIGIMLLAVKWITEYTGLYKILGAWIVILLANVVSMALTIILDLNDFEGNIETLTLSAIILSLLPLWWKRISVYAKRSFLFLFTSVIIWSALTHQQIFDSLVRARCLYIKPNPITPQNILESCEQILLPPPLMVASFIITVIALGYLLAFFVSYWKEKNTALYRKMIFAAILVMLVCAPFKWRNLNNTNQFDIVPWKQEIYSSYLEILGRRPEQKDIDFYARTNSFTMMPKIRDVLYESKERKIKINLIFNEVLKRDATAEEMHAYVANRYPVRDIYTELKRQSIDAYANDLKAKAILK